MNHRLKDKAATLSATSLRGHRDEGVSSHPRSPRTCLRAGLEFVAPSRGANPCHNSNLGTQQGCKPSEPCKASQLRAEPAALHGETPG